MKQYTENQYDDDLTVGTDDYDDSYYTGSVDLFEFSTDEESPISRLKSLILSIDWEITDEILLQFNEELVDLRDIWAGEKINLVYVQALEKISKYIYQKKANSHPSAIKLLLTLYHNLEKIVSETDLTEEQKKEILTEDVKRFESLKRHIGQQPESVETPQVPQPKQQKKVEDTESENDLLNLKAIVLGIDWEITDQDLNDLRREVVRLEEKFANSRPKLILLQGIGTLGAYIKLKKSNAHADAFKVLHLFYESLEKIVTTSMNLEEEKAILFPAVEKFNSFKTLLGPTITPEAINRDEKEAEIPDGSDESVVVTPAFADLPEKEIKGFQAEEEAQTLGITGSGNVDTHVESFFTDSGFESAETPVHIDGTDEANRELHELALQGVNVEIDDEEEDEYDGSLSADDELPPALSAVGEEKSEIEPSPAVFREELAQDEEQVGPEDSPELATEKLTETSLDSSFLDEGEENTELDFGKLDRDVVLKGVDVETEADDDSDEEALPTMGGELAPALAENDEVSIYNAEIFENTSEADTADDEIFGTLDGFFDDEIDSHLSAAPKVEDEDLGAATAAAVGSENETGDIESPGDSFSNIGLEPTENSEQDEEPQTEAVDSVPSAMEDAIVPEDDPAAFADQDQESDLPETQPEFEDETIAFVSDSKEKESPNPVFDDDDFEQIVDEGSSEDVLVESSGAASLEEEGKVEQFTEVDEQLDSFFDLEEGVEELEEDKLLFSIPEDTSEDSSSLEGDIATPALDEGAEEEVVFELAEEEPDEEEGLLSNTEPEIGQVEDTAFDEPLAPEDESFSPATITEDTFEDVEEFSENPTMIVETDQANDVYASLQTCVDSLGIELDDKVISGLSEEINNLQQNLSEKPLEKTFLQLLSTISRHIDQNRYDSNSNAYGLLQSVCTALTTMQEDDLHQNQEMLLAETQKVLMWQEEILAQQAARSEAELTIGNPVLNDLEEAPGDFDESTAMNHKNNTLDDTGSNFSDQSDSADESPLAGEDTKIFTNDLKQEISTLRQSLQDEIAALRNELKGNYP